MTCTDLLDQNLWGKRQAVLFKKLHVILIIQDHHSTSNLPIPCLKSSKSISYSLQLHSLCPGLTISPLGYATAPHLTSLSLDLTPPLATSSLLSSLVPSEGSRIQTVVHAPLLLKPLNSSCYLWVILTPQNVI